MAQATPLAMYLAVSLAVSVLAQSNNYGTGDFGPWGFPLVNFNKSMDAPSATGEYTLEAPDTSVPYPASSGQTDKWLWKVSVTADIPFSLSDPGTAAAQSNKSFTGSRVVLQAPTGSESEQFHDTWRVCVVRWQIDADKFPAKLREDDGSCKSVLSEECIRGVEAKTVQQYRAAASSSAPCSCPNLSEVSECGGDQAQILTAGGACQATTFNATEVRDWPQGRLDVQRYGGPAHDAGNRTAYNETGSLAWPVLVLWGPSENAPRNETGQLDIPDTAAKLTCVRANQAAQGQSVPGPLVNSSTVSAGYRAGGFSVSTLVSGALLAGAWAALW